jgi:hypothetical protein
MGEHIVDGPLARARGTVQPSSGQTRGKRCDGLRLFFELSQGLVDRKRPVVHDEKCCTTRFFEPAARRRWQEPLRNWDAVDA